MLTRLNELYYHKLKVRFTTSKRVEMHCWFGAVLRNRFLKAADTILDENGTSLRFLLAKLPLHSEHFMFKRLEGGFPKAFLFRFDEIAPRLSGFSLDPDRVYTIELIVIGNYSRYINLFSRAIEQMFSEGFGHPIVPMSLIDISEGDDGYLYCRGRELGELSYPISLKETLKQFNIGKQYLQLELSFNTPTSLISRPGKVDILGYQSRLNNFPSLYQFIRSVCYRLASLIMIYCDPQAFVSEEDMNDAVDAFVADVAPALLLDASISWQHCYSSPRKEGATYKMNGYTGRLVFGTVPQIYLPVLHFASDLAVGNDVNYGLGAFGLRYREEITD